MNASTERTIEKLKSPSTGDTYNELLSIYMYVVDVSDFGVISIIRRNNTYYSELTLYYNKKEDFFKENSYSKKSENTYWTYSGNYLKTNSSGLDFCPSFEDYIIDNKLIGRKAKMKYNFKIENSNEEYGTENDTFIEVYYDNNGLKITNAQ